MGFETLLGNDRLKQLLNTSLEKGRISHFYLISGPLGSGRHTLARLLAAAILCRGVKKPCGSCGPCRKVFAGLHPDFITVEDPEHKTVAVRLVRQIREDVFIRPNESDYKIYLFPQELGIEGQNALLKILEEPPKHAVFLLLTENPEKLLPTIRSRCTELKMQALPEKLLITTLEGENPGLSREDILSAVRRSGGFLGQAREILAQGGAVTPQSQGFARSFAARDTLGLLEILVPMEKWKRDALLSQLQSFLELTEQALACRAGSGYAGSLPREMAAGRSSSELLAAAKALRKAMDYAAGNVSPGAVCGYLSWALRE